MAGEAPQGPGGGALLVRIVDGEDLGIGLLVLLLQIAAARIGPEAAGIDAHHVDGGLALHDPVGQLPARAARGGDAEAVALVQPEVLKARGRTHDRAAVGGVGDGAVIDLLHPHLAEGRDAGDGGLDIGAETVQVLLEQLVFRLGIGAVHIAGRRADLVGAEQQAPRLLPHVPAAVALPQHAHFRQARGLARLDVRMGLGDDVLVFHRDHRHVEADHGPGPPGEVAGAGDHVLAGNVPLVGLDQPLPVGLLDDAGHGGVAVDGRAPLTGPAGQGLGQVGGLDIAVRRMLDGPDQVVGPGQGPDGLHLVRGEEVDFHPDGAGDAGVIAVLVHPVLRPGEADVAHIAEADVQLRLGLEGRIEAHRVLVHLADGIAEIEQGQEPRRMPGGAGGQLLALQQHAVAPAHAGQVIERADPDNSPANDDGARM